jgi:hypothetical protein
MSSERKFYIAGVQHHLLSTVISKLSEGDELDLVPEPTNKFDPNAVKIEYKGVMCGYIPKKFSAEIAGMLGIDTDLVCEITKLDPSAKPWKQCEVIIKEETDEESILDDEYDNDDKGDR